MSVPAAESASLHPATVTGYSTGDVLPFRRRRAAVDRPRSGAVRSRRPHPAVWAAALDLADGDASRVILLPDGSVEVRNAPVR